MTADVDLLPLPSVLLNWPHPTNHAAIRDYARANVAHATAAKDAEIEALREEVERLTLEMGRLQQQYDERTACMIVHRGSALACSDAVRAAYSDEHERAERLAEALRRYRNEVPLGHQPHMLAHEVDALLNPTTAQENDDA